MQVSINMAMSMDGKIATKERGPIKLGSALDSARMDELRSENDIVVNGSGTFRAYPFPLRVKSRRLQGIRLKKGLKRQPVSAIVSSHLDISLSTPWQMAYGIERWVICGAKAPTKRIRLLEQSGVRVFVAKTERPQPKEILALFALAGCRNILLEGGGEFNAAFLEQNLVDTIHLTVVPVLVGGAESPTFFEGKGLRVFSRFRLTRCVNKKGELFLTYKRKS